jgi:hypothetical protein
MAERAHSQRVEELRIHSGGNGHSFEVVLDPDSGEIVRKHFPPAGGGVVKEVRLRPSAFAWGWFRADLARAGVFSWEGRYDESGVFVFGTQEALPRRGWSVVIDDGEHVCVASGSRGYPPKWRDFCLAVSALTGGLAFD